MAQYVVTGIGTEVGKTVVSAILAEALKASYWKPVQAGDLDFSDSMKVDSWTSENVRILPEAYLLKTPMSPHASADIDGIELSNFDLPQVEGNLLIEGAGGLLVPLNNSGRTYRDVFKDWSLPTFIVSRHYLGSINHTLMTIEILQAANVPIEGIIFVGEKHSTTELAIAQTGVKILGRVPIAEEVNAAFIREQAAKFESFFTKV